MGHPQIAAFAREANGSAQPAREIAGQKTLFTRTMHDMTYDPVNDEIIVPQFFAFAILTFDGGADGNVAPKRKIFGPSTQLLNPHAMDVDPINDEIIVPGREFDHRILFFPRLADGDVAPTRILNTPGEPERVGVDPVNDVLVVSMDPGLLIYERTATGDDKPLRVIDFPDGSSAGGLMAINPANGTVFVKVGGGGRHEALDYIGVWSIYDDGEVAPRWQIGGPGGALKDGRGVAIDPQRQLVFVTDKTLNSILTFHVPEAFR